MTGSGDPRDPRVVREVGRRGGQEARHGQVVRAARAARSAPLDVIGELVGKVDVDTLGNALLSRRWESGTAVPGGRGAVEVIEVIEVIVRRGNQGHSLEIVDQEAGRKAVEVEGQDRSAVERCSQARDEVERCGETEDRSQARGPRQRPRQRSSRRPVAKGPRTGKAIEFAAARWSSPAANPAATTVEGPSNSFAGSDRAPSWVCATMRPCAVSHCS